MNEYSSVTLQTTKFPRVALKFKTTRNLQYIPISGRLRQHRRLQESTDRAGEQSGKQSTDSPRVQQ